MTQRLQLRQTRRTLLRALGVATLGGVGVGTAGALQGSATFEVLSTDAGETLSYRFRVDGNVEPASADGNSADPDGGEWDDDIITHSDGTTTVTGRTGDNEGDVFTVYGPIRWFRPTRGTSGYRLELDDRDVTARLA